MIGRLGAWPTAQRDICAVSELSRQRCGGRCSPHIVLVNPPSVTRTAIGARRPELTGLAVARPRQGRLSARLAPSRRRWAASARPRLFSYMPETSTELERVGKRCKSGERGARASVGAVADLLPAARRWLSKSVQNIFEG